MTYNQIADSAQDADLKRRIAACFAEQDHTLEQPEALASVHMWRICAVPEISAAYAYAVDTQVEDPGKNEGAVTDAMILAAVQDVLGTGD